MNYTKPDIFIGTESWLKGVKPGKDPTTDAIKSSEVFPIQLIGTTEGPLVESSD
jgi:hypothetical protein